MSDPKDPNATQGNGHDASVSKDDIEKENVKDEVYEERGKTGNGHKEDPKPETPSR